MNFHIDNPYNICKPIIGVLIIVGVVTGTLSLYLAVILLLMEMRVMFRWKD